MARSCTSLPRSRIHALVVLFLVACSPPPAKRITARDMFVHAKVTASSTFVSLAREYSLDPDQVFLGRSSWCEGNPRSPLGEWIAVTFDHAIDIAQLAVNNTIDTAAAVGVPHGAFAHVLAVDAVTDDGRKFQLAADGQGAFFANLGGPPIREITLTITKVDRPDGIACIPEIVASRAPDKTYRFYPGDPVALSSLFNDITELRFAMAACDDKRLAKLVEVPIDHVIAGHRGNPDRHEPIADAGRLAALCRAKHYSLGSSGDDALAHVSFDTAETVTLWPHSFAWSHGRWLLHEVVDME